MARPRVFVSSTYYDLKYIRSSLEMFIESLGFDAVLSERGDVLYAHDAPPDQSCAREVENCDIFVLIMGGRYGSESSESKAAYPDKEDHAFFDAYESVTKEEHSAAVERDIPVFLSIERSVYAEYLTHRKIEDRTDIKYAHVDSANVFRFIKEILGKQRNNPMQTFGRFSDIEGWLREQCAGLFPDMLYPRSNQQQIESIAAQVRQLAEFNTTLQRYLEEVMGQVSPERAAELIQDENGRLRAASELSKAADNRLIRYLSRTANVSLEFLVERAKREQTLEGFVAALAKHSPSAADRLAVLHLNPNAHSDYAHFRVALGLKADDQWEARLTPLGIPTEQSPTSSPPRGRPPGTRPARLQPSTIHRTAYGAWLHTADHYDCFVIVVDGC